jgi:hypothetical protein
VLLSVLVEEPGTVKECFKTYSDGQYIDPDAGKEEAIGGFF